ncbi:MAG: hypothetical protein LWW86_15000 [Micrococcales bacterium]|nr:hypothetical protein [Micrococcales bacterium]
MMRKTLTTAALAVAFAAAPMAATSAVAAEAPAAVVADSSTTTTPADTTVDNEDDNGSDKTGWWGLLGLLGLGGLLKPNKREVVHEPRRDHVRTDTVRNDARTNVGETYDSRDAGRTGTVGDRAADRLDRDNDGRIG